MRRPPDDPWNANNDGDKRLTTDLARDETAASFAVGVEPFQREAVFNPLLLAGAVHGDGRVAGLFEARGDRVAAGAGAGAVHDDRRLPVRQQRRRRVGRRGLGGC